ncbi:MAG: AAA family ATPase [Neomegalonema sp.]
MRLRSLSISRYKNLRDFSLHFDGEEFIDIFVGKNGCGKSNFIEALIEIFDHLYNYGKDNPGPGFEYSIGWETDCALTKLAWQNGELSINRKPRKRLGRTPLPTNVIVYYSGQNETVSELIERYQARYRSKVRKANVAELPRFSGIGPDYNALLLALMLMMPEEIRARQFLCAKLGIEGVGGTTWLKLRRPGKGIVHQSRQYDPFEDDQLFWGVQGVAREFLDRLLRCIIGDFTPGSLYARETDTYRLEIDVEKFREIFSDTPTDDVFCQFNALRALGMIEDVSIPVRLGGEVQVTSRAFSDGQFQSIYLFAISELFKDRECVTLLDEPDAFLHPEWQYDFLSQVLQISEQAAKTNHILMSSHSASTIAAKVQTRLRVFELNGGAVITAEKDKSEIITSLSAGLISFTEAELRLSIDQVIRDTKCPILFTEGPSDVLILKRAWDVLMAGQPCEFAIESGFGRSFLRTLFKNEKFIAAHRDRLLFALFDFDDAYNDWHQLGDLVHENPDLCLVRRRPGTDHFALLLPVPENPEVRRQVIQDESTKDTFKHNSLMSIEHLFFHCPEVRPMFREVLDRPGQLMEFPDGQKAKFAGQVIPSLAPDQFENLRPIFDQILTKIRSAQPVEAN